MSKYLRESPFSPEEWARMRDFLDGCIAKTVVHSSGSPTANALCDLMEFSRNQGQFHVGVAVGAMVTILSRGNVRELLFVLNQMANDCSPLPDVKGN